MLCHCDSKYPIVLMWEMVVVKLLWLQQNLTADVLIFVPLLEYVEQLLHEMWLFNLFVKLFSIKKILNALELDDEYTEVSQLINYFPKYFNFLLFVLIDAIIVTDLQ